MARRPEDNHEGIGIDCPTCYSQLGPQIDIEMTFLHSICEWCDVDIGEADEVFWQVGPGEFTEGTSPGPKKA